MSVISKFECDKQRDRQIDRRTDKMTTVHHWRMNAEG